MSADQPPVEHSESGRQNQGAAPAACPVPIPCPDNMLVEREAQVALTDRPAQLDELGAMEVRPRNLNLNFCIQRGDRKMLYS